MTRPSAATVATTISGSIALAAAAHSLVTRVVDDGQGARHTIHLPRLDAGGPPLPTSRAGELLAHRDQVHRTSAGYGERAPIVGYGRHAGDGADQWPERRVDTADELLDALAESGPLVVVLASDVKLPLWADVSSHKVLIGERDGERWRRTITGHGLRIRTVEHVIVSQLRIVDVAGDGIDISRGSRDVWIDRVEVARVGDGAIDITRGATFVTVSESWIHDVDKAMLIGADDTHEGDRQIRVSLLGNRFGPAVGRRLPALRYGVVESRGNTREDWDGDAVSLRMGASMSSCDDTWIPGSRSDARIAVATGATWAECP